VSFELEAARVTKMFGSRAAVRGVSVRFRSGEIHAVLGENGAGKSTLLRLCAGQLAPSEGEIRIDGVALAGGGPAEAVRLGVGLVEQHFALVDSFDAVDNVALGFERTRFGRIDRRTLASELRTLGQRLGLTVPLDVPTGALGVADRQRVELLRALHRRPKLLFLDEPTAVLAASEVDALYALLGRLREEGTAVVVVTHRLTEVVAHAARVTVLRQGEKVLELERESNAFDEETLARQALGHTLGTRAASPSMRSAGVPPLLVARNVELRPRLRGVSIELFAGEVVGVAGVEGNGQDELVDVLSGYALPTGGTVQSAPRAVVYGDRHRQSLVLSASVADNAILGEHTRFRRQLFYAREVAEAEALRRVQSASVVPADLKLPVSALSGGNQQKLVFSRAEAAVARGARVLLLAHPTRGIDARAAAELRARVTDLACDGAAVLVVSADLAELRSMCHRLVVLSAGVLVGEFPPDAPDELIGQAMLASPTGASPSVPFNRPPLARDP
jgi:simple sugar transport system ATP-binding protein